jgi:hypothetical protein
MIQFGGAVAAAAAAGGGGTTRVPLLCQCTAAVPR